MSDRLFAKLAETPIPTPVNGHGAPEVYCDLAIHRVGAETVTIKLCRENDGQPGEYEVVGVIIMPVSGWQQSHAWARLVAERERGN